LKQIVKNVSDALGVEVKFAPDCADAGKEAAALKGGEALLLENLRFYPEEEGKPVGIDKQIPNMMLLKADMKKRQVEFAKIARLLCRCLCHGCLRYCSPQACLHSRH
jgi:phosphoglycerate kinase